MKLVTNLHQKGFFELLSGNLFSQAIGFICWLVVAKLLSPEDFGNVRILQAYFSLSVILAGFGMNTAVLKLCSEKRNTDDRHSILHFSTRRAMLLSTVVLILVLCLSLSNLVSSSDSFSPWIFVYHLALPFSVLTSISLAYLQATKRFKLMARLQAAIRFEISILILAFTLQLQFAGFVIGTIAGHGIGILLIIYSLPRMLSMRNKLTSLPENYGRIAVYSLLANFTNMITQYADLFILDNLLLDRELIGFYSLATVLVIGAMQVTHTVQSISTPYFSERDRDESWFRQKLLSTQLRMSFLGSFVAVGIYLAAWFIIPLIYGDSYRITLDFLLILLLKYFLYSSCAIIGVALVGLGLMRFNFYIALISAPVSIALSIAFLQEWGIIGVAWAQVVTNGVVFCLVLLIGRYAIGLHFRTVETHP